MKRKRGRPSATGPQTARSCAKDVAPGMLSRKNSAVGPSSALAPARIEQRSSAVVMVDPPRTSWTPQGSGKYCVVGVDMGGLYCGATKTLLAVR